MPRGASTQMVVYKPKRARQSQALVVQKAGRNTTLARARAPYMQTALTLSRRISPRSVSMKERKYFDTDLSYASLGSDSAASTLVKDLAIVPQGNTVNTRVGKKLRAMRLAFKGAIYCLRVADAGAGTSPATMARLSIVWDREPDKAALVPTTLDVYTTNEPSALANRDNAPRFKILREMMFNLSGQVSSTSAGANTQCLINEFLSFSRKDLEVIWTKTDTTGATAAKIKGNLLAVWTLDQTVSAGGIQALVHARLDFEDN